MASTRLHARTLPSTGDLSLVQKYERGLPAAASADGVYGSAKFWFGLSTSVAQPLSRAFSRYGNTEPVLSESLMHTARAHCPGLRVGHGQRGQVGDDLWPSNTEHKFVATEPWQTGTHRTAPEPWSRISSVSVLVVRSSEAKM